MEHRDTSRVSGLCWPRQRSQDKSSMWELKQGWLVMLSKQPCPNTGAEHKEESRERKGSCQGEMVKWYYCQALHIVKSQAGQLKP